MNFETFVRVYSANNKWADKAEEENAPLPIVPWKKPKVVKRLVNSTPLGIKKN